MKRYIYFLIILFISIFIHNLSIKESYVSAYAYNTQSNNDGPLQIEVDDTIEVNLHQETDTEWQEEQRDAARRSNEQQKQNYAQQQMDRGQEEQNCTQGKTFLANNTKLLTQIEDRIKFGNQEMARLQPMVDKNKTGVTMNTNLLTQVSKKAKAAAAEAAKGADGLGKIPNPTFKVPSGGPMTKAIWLFSGGKNSI